MARVKSSSTTIRVAGLAVLLEPVGARGAGAAGVDEAAHPDDVAHLPLRHLGADARDLSDDLVPGNHRKRGVTPLVADLMQIGVTYAAVEDVDDDVLLAWLTALERERTEGGFRIEGGVRAGGNHGAGE